MSNHRSSILLLILLLFGSLASTAGAQMAIPTDVKPTCTVPSSTFDSWFRGGSPTPNGPVRGANSVNFPVNNTVCDFYTWGAQMFLWLTSPSYGSDLTLTSPAILNVLPADSRGVRYYQPSGGPMNFGLRVEKFDDIGEVGQAGGGGVLLSQQGSLVYYGVHTNQIYGYFLTGQKNGQISATVFPRNAQDLGEVVNYAKNAFPGQPILDAQTLVMEIKSSWVAAARVPDPDQFITIDAVVPKFDTSSSTTWPQDGHETTKLALVGLHIVGTVKNHPEFVWITYEHILNTPDVNYYYTNTSNQVALQSYDSSGNFLFIASGASPSGANVECMKFSGNQIVANTSNSQPVCSGGIVPSNTVRTFPWGSQGNSQASKVVDNNTLLLSLNHSIRSQLPRGDIRANYVQAGGIWTSAPSPTADAPIPDTNSFSSSDLRGSLQAFNSTMETYHQGTSCFTCHAQSATAPNSFQPFELSHIYSQIAPLTTGGK